MSFLDEKRDARPISRPLDVLTEVLGQRAFNANHRFPDLTMTRVAGAGPRLVVCRFYWAMKPQLAIDFKSELRFGKEEARVKAAFFKARGISYLLLEDQWDLEGLEAAREATADVPQTPRRPSVGPRRRG